MGGGADDPSRRRREPSTLAIRLARAERLVELAWRDLPLEHRLLLENIGAAQRQVVAQELGTAVHELLRSAGYPGLSESDRGALAQAAGLRIEELRLVVINADHPALRDLAEPTYEAMLVRVAWHEWAHALSVVRATPEDGAAGERLLCLAPKGVQENIRRGTTVSSSIRMRSSPRSTRC